MGIINPDSLKYLHQCSVTRVLLTVVLVLSSNLVLALPSSAKLSAPEKNNLDIATLLPFKQTQVIKSDVVYDQPYLLYLDSVERLPNQINSDKVTFIDAASIAEYTLVVPSLYETDLTMERIHTKLRHTYPDSVTLFDCRAKLCGPNNIWANHVFHNSKLAGLGASQHYTVTRIKHTDTLQYIVVYVVQRGTKAVYAQIEIVTENILSRFLEVARWLPQFSIGVVKKVERVSLTSPDVRDHYVFR